MINSDDLDDDEDEYFELLEKNKKISIKIRREAFANEIENIYQKSNINDDNDEFLRDSSGAVGSAVGMGLDDD